MKIVQLDLLAFGPFTNRSLHFGNKVGLHIVHGPNEAGKSSSLRALRCLLYGIPSRTSDNFIHEYGNMRIGAVVEAADGTRLEFIRRKGNAKTLRGPDDNKVFDDKQLVRLLQGIDENEFRQRFGIDYEELRRGGESLVCGSGNLAEILFAAGSGVADLRTIQQELREEADKRFKPAASKPTINARLSEYKQAQQSIRDAQLPTSEWCRRDKELNDAKHHLAQLNETLKAKRVEHNRLKRICDSLPLIRKRGMLREQLEQLIHVPLLSERFPAERTEAQNELKHAIRTRDTAREEIAKLEDELSRVKIPTGLLSHRTAIEGLHKRLDAYVGAVGDRRLRITERNTLQEEAYGLLQKLGRPPQFEEAKRLELPIGQKRRIRELASNYGKLFERLKQCEQSLVDMASEIRQVEEKLGQLSESRDIAELQRTIRFLRSLGNLDQVRADIAASISDRHKQAQVDLARLRLFDGSLEELERLPIPSAETIARFDREFAQAEKKSERFQDQYNELLSARQEVQVRLDALRLEADVPSEAELEQVRLRRDQGWRMVQQALSDADWRRNDEVAKFIGEFAPSGDLADAFSASMAKADEISDRLRREAERVAQRAELTARLQQVGEKLHQAQVELDTAHQQQIDVQSAWRALWEPIGIEPLTPSEMASWRNHQQDLVKLAGEIRQDQTKLDRMIDESNSHKTRLKECLTALNLSPASEDESLLAAVDRAEELATTISEANQQRETLTRDHKRLIQERPKAEGNLRAARAALEEWKESWEAAVAALGLDRDCQPREASDVLEAADEILRLLHDADKLEVRIREMDDYAAQFEQSTKHLLEQVAPDLLDTIQGTVESAVESLFDRMNQAKEDQAKVNEWQEQLKKHQSELRNADQNIFHWQTKLEQLCQQAGCSAPEELSQAEELSKRRQDSERVLEDVERKLIDLAAGTPLDTWIAEVASYDSDEANATLGCLEDGLRQLDSDKEAAAIHFGQLDQLLKAMDGRGDAAEAQAHAELLLANIRSEAEEYIRLRLASELLARAMERFREANQNPVLERASELFAQLTRGSFSGMQPDYDGAGKPKLMGVRPNCTKPVDISGMSDGTCDQLYLALRIALLESSLEGREPLPFIVDDILIMFDDDRAAAALEVFAKLAEKTQVIFFTHHRHLIDVACNAVPEDRLAIHQLVPTGATAEREAATT